MKSIIHELYASEFLDFKSIEEKELYKKMKIEEARDKKHDAIWNTLSPEQKTLFREWEFEEGDVWMEEIEEAYAKGFKIGALLGLELGHANFEI